MKLDTLSKGSNADKTELADWLAAEGAGVTIFGKRAEGLMRFHKA
jgi:hypothetical protein